MKGITIIVRINKISWITELNEQFENLKRRHPDFKIRSMEQVSSLAINPIDYKIDPNHTNFEDVINDLEQPELFQSKTYVPIDIIKTI